MNNATKIGVLILFFFFISKADAQLLHVNENYSYYSLQSDYGELMHPSVKPIYRCDIEPDSTAPHDFIPLGFSFNHTTATGRNVYVAAAPLFSAGTIFNSRNAAVDYGFGAGVSLEFALDNVLGFHYDIAYLRECLPIHTVEFSELWGVYPGMGRKSNPFFPQQLMQNTNLSYRPFNEITFEAGFGKHFIGDGYRSMLLSYNAWNYPYLKAEVDIWKLKYQWVLAQLKDINVPEANSWSDFTSKYVFYHYLDWNVCNWLTVGVFEAIISGPDHGLEPAYFNPFIFYRPVEFSLGSVDNALMGLNTKISLNRNNHVYAQFVLDDFNIAEFKGDIQHFFRSDDASVKWGFFGNKYAVQLGFRSNHVFSIAYLSFFTELNAARPYTYSHHASLQNYGHFNQALAHPLGANFVESVSGLRYINGRYRFEFKTMFAVTGLDSLNTHYGSDIYKPTMDALQNGNIPVNTWYNTIGQGVKTHIFYPELSVWYYLNTKHNLSVQLRVAYRRLSNSMNSANDFFVSFGVSSFLFKNDQFF